MATNSNEDEAKLLLTQENYLIKEFDKLNSELENLLEEIRSREKYSLTIIAGIAVWVFTHLSNTDVKLLTAVSCIPFITTLIYGVSVKFLYDNIKWIGAYLRRIEDYFLKNSKENLGNSFGWENYFDTENRKSKFVKITWIAWILQLMLTIILVVLVLNKDNFINNKDNHEKERTHNNS